MAGGAAVDDDPDDGLLVAARFSMLPFAGVTAPDGGRTFSLLPLPPAVPVPAGNSCRLAVRSTLLPRNECCRIRLGTAGTTTGSATLVVRVSDGGVGVLLRGAASDDDDDEDLPSPALNDAKFRPAHTAIKGLQRA